MQSVLMALTEASQETIVCDLTEAIPAQPERWYCSACDGDWPDGAEHVHEGVVSRLHAPAREAVPAAGQLHFRIRRVGLDEMAPTSQLAMSAMAKETTDKAQGHAVPANPRAEQDAMRRILDIQRDYLCRGVVSASRDGVTWEAVKLVEDRAAAAPEAGRMHISALPTAIAVRLSAAIMNLSNDGEAAGRRISSFLGA